MSALPPIADIQWIIKFSRNVPRRSGFRILLLAYEQEVAAVVASLAYVGVCWAVTVTAYLDTAGRGAQLSSRSGESPVAVERAQGINRREIKALTLPVPLETVPC